MAGGSDSGSNFRSSYYDKAGIRCNLTETKALDLVVSRNPVDRTKLCSLLQRISVPPTYRARVWKLILGVTPADAEIAAGVEEDRRCQFEELKSTLEVMRLIDGTSSSADIVTLMILLERGELALDPRAQLATPAIRDLQLMFGVMCRVAPKLQDAYWLSRNFYNHLLALRLDTKELINQTRTMLEKDDPALLERILTVCSNNRGMNRNQPSGGVLPIENWFNIVFASVLPDAALLKVWDKFIGGLVNKHLATTAKVIIVSLRPRLMPPIGSQRPRHQPHHYSCIHQNYHNPSAPTSTTTPALNSGRKAASQQQEQLQPHSQGLKASGPTVVQRHQPKQPLHHSNSNASTQTSGPQLTKNASENAGPNASDQQKTSCCCTGGSVPDTEMAGLDDGDCFQPSQLIAMLNQPLSEEMAAPLLALL